MTWEDKLKSNEVILSTLYRAIGNSGHGRVTVTFNKSNNKVEITPEPVFRDVEEFEKYKEAL